MNELTNEYTNPLQELTNGRQVYDSNEEWVWRGPLRPEEVFMPPPQYNSLEHNFFLGSDALNQWRDAVEKHLFYGSPDKAEFSGVKFQDAWGNWKSVHTKPLEIGICDE